MSRSKLLFAAAFLSVLLPAAAKAEYEAGVLAGKSGNQAEAYRQWEESAKLGESQSQRALGLMFREGRFVLQDYVKAHMWLNLAAASGDADAANERDRLALKMTTDQVAQAQKLALDFKPETRPVARNIQLASAKSDETVLSAPREDVTIASAETAKAPATAKPSPLVGVWLDRKNGLIMSIEQSSDGAFVMRQALTDDKYSYAGEVIGEFAADDEKQDSFTGRHLWGGWRTGDAEWGEKGGMTVRKSGENQLYVLYKDSKYQGGWTYDKIN